MKRINQRRLLLYFISGRFSVTLIVNALAESQGPGQEESDNFGSRTSPIRIPEKFLRHV